jgi:hypothetical protein
MLIDLSNRDTMAVTQLSHGYIPVEVYYKERFAISYQRSTKYTTQDLLSKRARVYVFSLIFCCNLLYSFSNYEVFNVDK